MKRKAIWVSSFLILASCANQSELGKNILFSGSSSLNSSAPTGGTVTGGAPTPAASLPVNAKVFKRSPFQSGATDGYTVMGNQTSPANPINYDKYLSGVHVSGTTGGLLKSNDLDVMTDQNGESSRAHADSSGNFFFSSVNDDAHQLGQLMVYYWLSVEKDLFNQILPGEWQAGGKGVTVYTLCTNQLNAYWAGISSNYICLGYVGALELAFDATVYSHEMGHAHLSYNSNGQIEQDNSTVSCGMGYCCPDAGGCAGAINEGQADVHSQIEFDSGVVGDFTFNNPKGIPGRDAEANSNLTASDMFNGTAIDPSSGQQVGSGGPEIHYMGGVWAAAWWTLRQSIGKDATNKIFIYHLKFLTGDDTFGTAMSQVLLADSKLFNSAHKAQITKAFAQHGISPL